MDKQDTAWLDPAAGEEPVRVQGKREGHACIDDVLIERAQQLATATHAYVRIRTLTYKALNGTRQKPGRHVRMAARVQARFVSSDTTTNLPYVRATHTACASTRMYSVYSTYGEL
jgi:hypothetical protein